MRLTLLTVAVFILSSEMFAEDYQINAIYQSGTQLVSTHQKLTGNVSVGATWLRLADEGHPQQFGAATLGYSWKNPEGKEDREWRIRANAGPLFSEKGLVGAMVEAGAYVEFFDKSHHPLHELTGNYRHLQFRSSSIKIGNPGAEYARHLYHNFFAVAEGGYLGINEKWEAEAVGAVRWEAHFHNRLKYRLTAGVTHSVYRSPFEHKEEEHSPSKFGAKFGVSLEW